MPPECRRHDRPRRDPAGRHARAGRDFVVPEDVKDVAVPALAHRITLRPEMWLRRVDPSLVVQEVLTAVPAPASGALPRYARHD